MRKKDYLICFSLFLIALIGLSLSVSADSIDSYNVREVVPLGEKLTVTGDYNGVTADSNNILCSFVLRENDDNTALKRLSDEYTFSNGTFYSEFTPTEPLFIRGQTYNVLTTCGNATASAIWSLSNPKPLQDRAIFEAENLKNAFLALFAFVFVIVALYILFK